MEIKDIISSGLLESYVLGMTSAEENQQVLKWAAQYPEVKEELDAIERTMEDYARAHAIEPRASLKQRVFEHLDTPDNNNTQERKEPAKLVPMSPAWKWMAAASVLLLIVSGLMNWNYYSKLQQSEGALTEARNQLIVANEKLDTMNADMSVVKNKYSQAVSLNGLPVAPGAAAKIFWIKNTGEVYIDPSNLPETPTGKQYQLWAIVDGKPVDAGMIITTKKDRQYRIQKMKTFGRAEAFAVTLEKEGGNPTPQGEMYVMGKM